VMLPTARRLFEQARTPKEMLALSPQEIDTIIRQATFHEQKAHNIHAIAERAVNEYDGLRRTWAKTVQAAGPGR